MQGKDRTPQEIPEDLRWAYEVGRSDAESEAWTRLKIRFLDGITASNVIAAILALWFLVIPLLSWLFGVTR